MPTPARLHRVTLADTDTDTDTDRDSGADSATRFAAAEAQRRRVPHELLAAEVGGAAMAASRHAICVTDAVIDEPGPRIEYVNQAYLDMLCCELDDCLGRSPRFSQGPLTDRAVLDRVRRGLQSGQTVYAQAINYRLNGEPFRLRWSIDPVLDESGRVTRYVGVLADVTQEERLRARLVALDALTTSLQQATGPCDPTLVAEWMVGALAPLIEDVGSVSVSVGRGAHRQMASKSAASGMEPYRQTVLGVVPIGHHGEVTVRAHPDAGWLLDLAAFQPLCAQLSWSLDRLGGLARSA